MFQSMLFSLWKPIDLIQSVLLHFSLFLSYEGLKDTMQAISLTLMVQEG